MKLGYFRLGNEAIAFWQSSFGHPLVDVNPRTRKPYILGWRSDYAKRLGKPVVMSDADDAAEMAALAGDASLRPVTVAEWVAFQRAGAFEAAA